MKRWFTAALAIVMILSTAQTGVWAALGEEAGIEAYVPPAETTGAEGLTIGDDGGAEDDPGADEAAPLTDAAVPADNGDGQYARVTAKQAALRETPDGAETGALAEGGTVLVLSRQDGFMKIAFNTQEGVVTAWAAAADLSLLDDGQTTAFLDALAASGAVALYDGNLDTPLETLAIIREQVVEIGAEAEVESDPVEAELAASGFSLTAGALEVAVGETAAISARAASGAALSPSQLKYSSSNSAVASVDASGNVTGVKSGSAVITVSYGGQNQTCAVTVPQEPDSIKMNYSSGAIGLGEFFTGLRVVASPVGTKAAVRWVSSNENVIFADEKTGELTALKTGTATITAYTRSGLKATCKLKVKKAPSSVTVSPSSMSLKSTGATGQLSLKFSSGTCGTVSFTSSNPGVATVSAGGLVTAVGKGSAVITATTYNGVSDTCQVTVASGSSQGGKGSAATPTAIRLNETKGTMGVGETFDGLVATLTMSSGSADDVEITWTSSKPSVVAVDMWTGELTALKTGTADITASTTNDLSATCRVTVKKAPTSISVSPSTLKLSVGGTETLGIRISKNSGLASVTFKSSNPAVAKVDAEGVVTAVAEGSAVITAGTFNGKTAQCGVTVGNGKSQQQTAKPKSLSLPSKATIGVGDTLDALEAVVTYQDGTTAAVDATDLIWSSSNKKVVSVDEHSGRLTALKKGTATITAQISGGPKDTCKVTVSTAAAGISLSPASVKLSAGGMEFQLTAKVTGVSAAEVSFTSSDPSVATVDDDGVITTVNAGKATITAATRNGKTATCAVTVTAMPAKASFSETQVTLGTDESVIPDVKVQTADGSETAAELQFRILAGPQYINLDEETGEITAVKAGTAVVGFSTHNGVSASNTCTVTVVSEVTGISLNQTSATMGAGESVQLKATVKAARGADTSVKWTSSDTGVARVSGGSVTGISAGNATITAEATNGLKATCKVVVYKAPTSLSLSPASGSVYVGEAGKYTVKLSGSAGGTISFESSNPAVAVVDDEGVVTGVAVGTVTITATTYNGVKATAKLSVKRRSSAQESREENEIIERVIDLAESQLGKPYKSKGGYKDDNPSGFDCSGLVYWCYYQVGIKLGDSPSRQASDNNYTKITSIGDLKRGDVVCFKSDSSSSVSHTGIYRGNGEFIHASSAGGAVIITDINKDYYSRNFVCGRRIVE